MYMMTWRPYSCHRHTMQNHIDLCSLMEITFECEAQRWSSRPATAEWLPPSRNHAERVHGTWMSGRLTWNTLGRWTVLRAGEEYCRHCWPMLLIFTVMIVFPLPIIVNLGFMQGLNVVRYIFRGELLSVIYSRSLLLILVRYSCNQLFFYNYEEVNSKDISLLQEVLTMFPLNRKKGLLLLH
jgi:hypothetical protein